MQPLVCILIPFRKWGQLVVACVENCLALDYENFRICLLPDEAISIPDDIRANGKVLVVETRRPDISRKRNLGIESNSDAEFFASIDSDAMPDRLWIKNAVAAFADDSSIGMVGGPDISPDYESLPERAVRNALFSFFASGNRAFMKARGKSKFVDDLRTANCFFRACMLAEIGCFDERMEVGEDSEICLRALKSGWKLWFSGDVVVTHHNRSLFFPFVKQRISAGYGVPPLLRRHPGMPAHALFLRIVPVIMLFYLSFGGITYFIGDRVFLGWLGGVGCYLALIVADAVRLSRFGIIEIALTSAAILVGNLGPPTGTVIGLAGLKLDIAAIYDNSERRMGSGNLNEHDHRGTA